MAARWRLSAQAPIIGEVGPSPRLLFHTVVLLGTSLSAGSCHDRQALTDGDHPADAGVVADRDAAAPDAPTDAPANFTFPEAAMTEGGPLDRGSCEVSCPAHRFLCNDCECCVVIL
jgi:hypothetical protein